MQKHNRVCEEKANYDHAHCDFKTNCRKRIWLIKYIKRIKCTIKYWNAHVYSQIFEAWKEILWSDTLNVHINFKKNSKHVNINMNEYL